MNQANRAHVREMDEPCLALAPSNAARAAGIGRTKLYQAISSGDLKSLKIGKRRLITMDALRAWLLAHEVAR